MTPDIPTTDPAKGFCKMDLVGRTIRFNERKVYPIYVPAMVDVVFRVNCSCRCGIISVVGNIAKPQSVALLCRNCGHEIVEGSTLTSEKSAKAIRSYNMTILGRNQLVQVFENAVPEKFDVITASTAELRLAGKPFLADTWWPNYEWTVCVCPSCGFHLGWYFQSGNIQSKLHKSFFGLVLDYLISEECKDLNLHVL
ncbi:hypothetical protein WUBG_00399 [Wuchereria bancrofti]|uniref:CULT domain-containing protein n=1 Tax=Wuchereria bancrofti TaxID=6293 RepID=J9FMU0_WUCBA|nr:hypothetical protein WUBG_00399 [Wuchereria bancrofti]